MNAERVALVILDGRGIGDDPTISGVAQAQTPVFDQLRSSYPHTTLITHGHAVWLPAEQMGNSEVGHMHLGAGRILYQDLVKISLACQTGGLITHPLLQQTAGYLKQSGKKLHLIGLLSDGGVHSHLDHLVGLIQRAQKENLSTAVLHCITDGRDTPPQSAVGYLQTLQAVIEKIPYKIATVMGRYYAMDRDNRRERIKIAYEAFVHGEGAMSSDLKTTIEQLYAAGTTDEFLPPIILESTATIAEGDVVLFRNFRTDRMRELVHVLTQAAMPEFEMQPLQLKTITMTTYDESFTNVQVLFPRDQLTNTLGEVLATYGKTQLRIAETEKYPHVTYFFSGGQETPFPGEERLMCPSPKVATYDLAPQMSAHQITEEASRYVSDQQPDFICLNFANPDMVGHTGNLAAVTEAVETVDTCLGTLIATLKQYGYTVIILADHGNAETMRYADGSPHTSHTIHEVPCILVTTEKNTVLRPGTLVDIAPTILDFLGIPQPQEMTGKTLRD